MWGKDRELQKQVRERERQMRRDYAGLVSKLVLLMGAGAAVRDCLGVDCEGLSGEKVKRGRYKRGMYMGDGAGLS